MTNGATGLWKWINRTPYSLKNSQHNLAHWRKIFKLFWLKTNWDYFIVWFQLEVLDLWMISSNNPVQTSSLSASMCQGSASSVFSHPRTHLVHTFLKCKRSYIMLIHTNNQWNPNTAHPQRSVSLDLYFHLAQSCISCNFHLVTWSVIFFQFSTSLCKFLNPDVNSLIWPTVVTTQEAHL